MLNIYFGAMEHAIYDTDVFFNNSYEDEWILNDFSVRVIKKIDKSTVLGPHLIESPVLGPISPKELSGGTKTLILIHHLPHKVFNASKCGDNCAKYILEIAKKQDITINLRHIMDFGARPFPIPVVILNNRSAVRDMTEMMLCASDFL
ncbi:MAG: DUF4869 domain-containing protein [Oscillospiraceae bacterium]|nr:DUF4869 domain-containing protein [Oscillospiraceae bacterium]